MYHLCLLYQCIIIDWTHVILGSCTEDQFECSDGECIPLNWLCDGVYADCSDAEDEINCGKFLFYDPDGSNSHRYLVVSMYGYIDHISFSPRIL